MKLNLSYEYKILDTDIYGIAKFRFSSEKDYPTYINYFDINIPFKNIENIYITVDGKDINYERKETEKGFIIKPDFRGIVVKKTEPKEFLLKFTQSKVVDKSSPNLVSFKLPAKFAEDIDTVDIKVTYDKKLGDIQGSSSINYKVSDVDSNYKAVTFNDISSGEIFVQIGTKPALDFFINEKLSNSSYKEQTFEINLPYEDKEHRIIIKSISHSPTRAYNDELNNIILQYRLEPNEIIDLNISGQILKTDTTSNIPDINDIAKLVKTNSFWDVPISEKDALQLYISNFSLKEVSEIEVIYKYVLERLSPSPSTQSTLYSGRGGASSALNRSSAATPDDYTDLLIALLRNKGIPTKMVIGYVVNPDSTGFFHSWAEAWNGTEWLLLDPAIDDREVGYNYNKKYYNHIKILSRVNNPVNPVIKFSSNNSIAFKYSDRPADIVNLSSSNLKCPEKAFYGKIVQCNLSIKNEGNSIISRVLLESVEGDSAEVLKNGELIVPQTEYQYSFSLEGNKKIDSLLLSTIDVGEIKITNPINLSVDRVIPIQIVLIRESLAILGFFGIINIVLYINSKIKIGMKKVFSIMVLFFSFFLFANSALAADKFVISQSIGTQSYITKKIPIKIEVEALEDIKNTDIQIVVNTGIIVESKFKNYFPMKQGEKRVLKAFLLPQEEGSYTVQATVTEWGVSTNSVKSEIFRLNIGSNLYISPIQQGTITQVIVIIVSIIVGIILSAYGVFLLVKKIFPDIKSWFSQPKY